MVLSARTINLIKAESPPFQYISLRWSDQPDASNRLKASPSYDTGSKNWTCTTSVFRILGRTTEVQSKL